MKQLDLFAHQTRRPPIAMWPEGFVPVSLSPAARPIAHEVARRYPGAFAVSLPGTCLLVRRHPGAIAFAASHDGLTLQLQMEPWALAYGRETAVSSLLRSLLAARGHNEEVPA